MSFQNLIGSKFGKWTIIQTEDNKIKYNHFICKCECGYVSPKPIHLTNLKKGLSTKCSECAYLSKAKSKIGSRHNELLIQDVYRKDGRICYKVLCSCGRQKETVWISKDVKACGECITNKVTSMNKIGKSYGLLKVISYCLETRLFFCQCSCGNTLHCLKNKINGLHPSCGCYNKELKLKNALNIVGFKFKDLKIVEFTGMKLNYGSSRAHYLVKCKCGKLLEKDISKVFVNNSCGCQIKQNRAKGVDQRCAKLTESDVLAIRELFASELYSRNDLCEIFSISKSALCAVLSRTTWKHI